MEGSSPTTGGFTLLELMVVMVIIGLASTLVFVATTGSIFRTEEHRFVEEFQAALMRAKASAMGRGEVVKVFIDGDGRRFSLDGKGWKKIPETIQIEAAGLLDLGNATHALYFYPDGSSSGGEIDIRREDGRRDGFRISRLFGRITHDVSSR